MKIYKKQDLAFSIRPYGVAGGNFLSLAAMAFFDLTAPGDLLAEQDLWKTVPEALGPGGILDEGLPKQRGELLLAGASCAPRGTTTQGLRATVRLGALSKSLAVFGDRFWLPDGSISDPRPFASLPLGYDRAFGGPDFPPNPTGKGLVPVALADGRTAVSLPNIEYSGQLLVARDDRPEPAGLGPLDITWPQRANYNGTYDERWKIERWPGYPDDTNFLLFNRAPTDQWIPDFFRGDEAFTIENMHPDLPRIAGALPGLRARLFVTLHADYRLFTDPATFTETFVEVPMRLETIWLFPTVLRGLVLYRGSIPNRDDEARDVVRVYAAWERLTEPAASIEEYAQRQRQAMNRAVPMDMTPFKEAGQQMQQAVKMVKNAPKTLARLKEAVAGRTPTMPVTPAEMAAKADAVAAGNLATIDTLEKVAKELHSRFGHLAEIDLEQYDGLRQSVKDALAGAKTTAGEISQAMDKAASVKANVLAQSNAFLARAPSAEALAARGLDINDLRKRGYDPNFRFPDDDLTGNPFHDAGFPFVVACRRVLEGDAEARDALRRLGLPDSVVRRAWLGLNPEEKRDAGQVWGHAPGPDGRPAAPVVLPAGLVFPRFDGAVLNRICIRPGAAQGDYTTPDGDVRIPDSDATPLALPPGEAGGNWVRASDELQALFLEEEIGDACGVIALADPGVAPGPDAAKSVAAAEVLAVILAEGTSLTGQEWTAWKAAYKNAVPVLLPKGRTVFDARAAGCALRALIMEVMPPDFARHHVIEPAVPEAGQPPAGGLFPPVRFPDLGLGQVVKDAMAEAQQAVAPLRQELDQLRQKGDAALADVAARQGKTLADLQAEAARDAARSPADQGAEAVARLTAKKEGLRRMQLLSPKTESRHRRCHRQDQRRHGQGPQPIRSGQGPHRFGREDLYRGQGTTRLQDHPGHDQGRDGPGRTRSGPAAAHDPGRSHRTPQARAVLCPARPLGAGPFRPGLDRHRSARGHPEKNLLRGHPARPGPPRQGHRPGNRLHQGLPAGGQSRHGPVHGGQAAQGQSGRGQPRPDGPRQGRPGKGRPVRGQPVYGAAQRHQAAQALPGRGQPQTVQHRPIGYDQGRLPGGHHEQDPAAGPDPGRGGLFRGQPAFGAARRGHRPQAHLRRGGHDQVPHRCRMRAAGNGFPGGAAQGRPACANRTCPGPTSGAPAWTGP